MYIVNFDTIPRNLSAHGHLPVAAEIEIIYLSALVISFLSCLFLSACLLKAVSISATSKGYFETHSMTRESFHHSSTLKCIHTYSKTFYVFMLNINMSRFSLCTSPSSNRDYTKFKLEVLSN